METIKILNPLQVAFYINEGIKPINISVGYNNKLVYWFKKEDTTQVWNQWKTRTH